MIRLRIYMAIGNKNVGPAIVIGVEESRAPSDVGISGGCEVRLGRDVFKPLRSTVPIESIVLKGIVGNEQIEQSIVIEVGGIDAHRSLRFSVSVHRSSRDHADIFEGAIASIAIEVVRTSVIANV